MAVDFIKLGDLMVPVLYRQAQNGANPTDAPSFTISDILQVRWENGVVCGMRDYDGTYHDVCVAMMNGGRTGFHDASEMIVSSPTESQSAPPAKEITIDIVQQQEGGGAVSLYPTQTFVVAPRIGGVASKKMYRSLYACEAWWPSAPTEEQQVKSYMIYGVDKTTEYNGSGGVVRITYSGVAQSIAIPLAYINKFNDTELYYDGEDEPTEDPNEQDPEYPSEPSEPEPDHTIIINPIVIPGLPTMGSATAGFLTMYKLSLATIQQFAADMFASSIWEAIKLFFTNPMDFLVGCMLLPFEPSTGSSYYPKFGIFTFEHSYPAVDNQYKEIDCGYVDVKKFWGSCFDYEPFTKLQIWLPYIGYRDIPTDEFMGEQLHVVYHCDCLTGDCVAFISTTGTPAGEYGPGVVRVLAQYYGNCGVRVPFSSVNFDAAVAAGINLIGAAASMGLSKGNGGVQIGGSRGGFHGADSEKNTSSGVVGISVDEGYSEPSGAGLAGATINMVESMKPTVQKGGAAGASNGYMSIQKPYLIKRIPHQNLPEGYAKHKGYPSNIGGTLSQFSGYAEVDDIQLNNIPAMAVERKEIMNWLSGGVLI